MTLRLWPVLALAASGAQGEVVINEIFSRPADPAQATEFVELFNPGSAEVSLSGWKLADAVGFTFPADAALAPGGYVVIAQDPEACRKQFGGAPLGPWTGHLRHNAAHLLLADAHGKTVDEVSYIAGFPWPAAAESSGSSIELLHPGMDRRQGSSWRSSKGHPTPGERNSATVEQPPPSITAVTHAPRQPHSGQAVTVTAHVSAPAKLSAVTLLYQVVSPGHYLRRTDEAYEKQWQPLPMTEAGKGVYTATLPAALQQHRTLLRYRITAEDAAGQTVRAPSENDEAPNFACFTWDGAPAWQGASEPGKTPELTFPASLTRSLPALTLLADASDVEHSQWDAGWNKRKITGTLVIGDHVYDHIVWHNRGQGSAYGSGKNKWGFHATRGADFLPPPSWGRPFAHPWTGIDLNSCSSPWVSSNRGMAGLDEAVSYRAYELAGVPASRTVPVPLRVITTEAEAPAHEQYQGDLWGLYVMIEDPDAAFLANHALPEGDIYKATGEKKHLDWVNPPADENEYDHFREKLGSHPGEEWWRTHLDLPAFYSFHALNRLLANVDLREGDNHYLYRNPAGLWSVLPWDLDMMFIPKSHQSGRVEEDHCFEEPALRVEYQNRCRELLDLLCSDATPQGGQFGQIVDEYAALVHPPGETLGWPELDQARWNFHPRTTQKGTFYRNPVDGGPDGNWKRELVTADFAGFVRFVTDFATPARPPEHPWQKDDGDPRGYGYGYLAHESEDDAIPATPQLHANGAPRSGRFQSTPYEGRKPFAARQWRLGAIGGPAPRRYEIESALTSPEIPEDHPDFVFLKEALRLTGPCRARVRVKDQTGRWSHWSAPVEFDAGHPR